MNPKTLVLLLTIATPAWASDVSDWVPPKSTSPDVYIVSDGSTPTMHIVRDAREQHPGSICRHTGELDLPSAPLIVVRHPNAKQGTQWYGARTNSLATGVNGPVFIAGWANATVYTVTASSDSQKTAWRGGEFPAPAYSPYTLSSARKRCQRARSFTQVAP